MLMFMISINQNVVISFSSDSLTLLSVGRQTLVDQSLTLVRPDNVRHVFLRTGDIVIRNALSIANTNATDLVFVFWNIIIIIRSSAMRKSFKALSRTVTCQLNGKA